MPSTTDYAWVLNAVSPQDGTLRVRVLDVDFVIAQGDILECVQSGEMMRVNTVVRTNPGNTPPRYRIDVDRGALMSAAQPYGPRGALLRRLFNVKDAEMARMRNEGRIR